MKKLFIVLLVAIGNGAIFTACTDAKSSMSTNKVVETTILPIQTPAVKTYNKSILPYLERALYALETDGAFYKWTDYTSCNVGIVAQVCTNTGIKEMRERVNVEYNDYIKYAEKMCKDNHWDYVMSWKQMGNYYCGITNKPVTGIIGDLQSKGFTTADIGHLEFLSDKAVLSNTDINTKHNYFAHQDNLIKYLKSWIDIIRKQNN